MQHPFLVRLKFECDDLAGPVRVPIVLLDRPESLRQRPTFSG